MRKLVLSLALVIVGTAFPLPGVRQAASAAQPSAAKCEPLPAVEDSTLKAKLDTIVNEAVAGGFAGQVALMREGNYIYRRSAGNADRAGKIPVSEKTLFQVASLTKYFTAALALKAVEEGVIDLNAPIAPLIEGTSLARQAITFSDLLAHRSGLGTSYAAEGKRTPEAAISAIDKAGIDESRKGTFRYSNDGYDLLTILLERAYGAPFEALVRRKLFAPACLTHARFWGETDLDDARIVGQPLRPFPSSLRGRNYGMLGSAGLLITASDLVAWQHALRSNRVLSAASLKELFEPRGAMRLGQATFGAFLIDHPALGHLINARGLETWGDNAYLNDYIDCGFTLAIVTSRGPANAPFFRDSISQAIEGILAGRCRAR